MEWLDSLPDWLASTVVIAALYLLTCGLVLPLVLLTWQMFIKPVHDQAAQYRQQLAEDYEFLAEVRQRRRESSDRTAANK